MSYLRDYPALQNVSSTQDLLSRSIYYGSRYGVQAALRDVWQDYLSAADSSVPEGASSFAYGWRNFEKADTNAVDAHGYTPLRLVLEAPSLHFHQCVSPVRCQPAHVGMISAHYEESHRAIVHLLAEHGASFTMPDGKGLTVGDHAFANITIDEHRILAQRDIVLGTLEEFAAKYIAWEPNFAAFFAEDVCLDGTREVPAAIVQAQRETRCEQIEAVGRLVSAALRAPQDEFVRSIADALPTQIRDDWSSRSWKIDLATMPMPEVQTYEDDLISRFFRQSKKTPPAAQITQQILQRYLKLD